MTRFIELQGYKKTHNIVGNMFEPDKKWYLNVATTIAGWETEQENIIEVRMDGGNNQIFVNKDEFLAKVNRV